MCITSPWSSSMGQQRWLIRSEGSQVSERTGAGGLALDVRAQRLGVVGGLLQLAVALLQRTQLRRQALVHRRRRVQVADKAPVARLPECS